MNTFNILNTATDASCSIFENNCRLKNNYAGPFAGNAFLISTNPVASSARVTGMYITNSSIDAYAPAYTFKCDQNPSIRFSSGNYCLIITGSRPHIFSSNSLVVNSPTQHSNTEFSGIQVYATTNPSISLISRSAIGSQAIRFINSSDQIEYLICKDPNCGIVHSSSDALTFNSFLRQSGNITSIRNIANPSNLNAILNVSGSINAIETCALSGTFCGRFAMKTGFGDTLFTTGMTICTVSRFLCNVQLACNLNSEASICANCFSGKCAVYADTAVFSPIGCFSAKVDSNCGIFRQICAISGTSYFSGIEATGLTLRNSLSISCITISDSLCYTGNINFLNRRSVTGIHTFAASGIQICATGTNNSIILNGNLSCINNLCACGEASFNNLCLTGSVGTNYFNTHLGVQGNITGFPLLSGSNTSVLCVSCVCASNSINTNSLTVSNSITYNGNITTACSGCFCGGLYAGLNSSGEIGAINSSKAWGVFALSGGIPLGATGFNFSDVRVAGTGMFKTTTYSAYNSLINFTCSSTTVSPSMSGFYYFFYGLRLNKPIRYPFAFSSTFMNTSIPAGTAPTGLLLQTTANIRYSGLYGSGTVANPVDNIMSQINLVNCGGFNTAGNFCSNDFEPFVVGKCYNEIVINVSPFDLVSCTSGYRYNANTARQGFLNGTGMFHIV
jgi:hypothetical protein